MAGLIFRSMLTMGSAAIVFIAGAAPALAQRTMTPRTSAPPVTIPQQRHTGSCPNRLQNPALYTPGYGSPSYPHSYSVPYMPFMANPYDTYSNMNYGNQAQSYGNYSKDAGAYGSESSKTYASNETERALTALGLPVKKGHLDWPLALDALPGEESRNLRQQIESLLLVMARASQRTKGNAGLVEEAKQALDRLDAIFYSNRYSMTLGTRKDASEFLSKLDNALSALQQKDYRTEEPRQKETNTQMMY
jgi:hypothetical protein